MAREIMEPDVWIAAGARKDVARVVEANGSTRAFIVASASVANNTPVVKDVEAALGDAHAGTHVGIGQHAPHESVQAATRAAREADADLLVSIGGGSVIDATKFVLVALSDSFAQDPPPHAAIPTTLSGAEFTLLAGETTEGPDGRPVKTGMADPRIVPTVALLDPEACAHTPRWLWAATGVRAVDHAIEGVTSAQATPATDARCLEAINAFAKHLPDSVADASDLEAGAACLAAGREASAGINYAGSGAGLSHKLGKAIGSTWNVPHGVTSAITLPPVLDYEAKRQPARVQLVADALGADSASAGVLALVEAVGLERKPLSEFGIKPTDAPRIVEYAIGKRDAKIEQLVLDLI